MDNEALAKMLDFVKGRGGNVRFDDYMKEHLFGESGYYSNHADIGPNGHFITWSSREMFAHMLQLYAKRHGLDGKMFLEIGGGEGEFKHNYMKYDPNVKYISVDKSAMFAKKQEGLLADSVQLPLKSDSIDGLIFSNELIDALPVRNFLVENDTGEPRLLSELSVKAGTSLWKRKPKLKTSYDAPVEDEFSDMVVDFMNIYRSDVLTGEQMNFAPDTYKVLGEMLRVLGKGRILIFDYGFGDDEAHILRREHFETPYNKSDKHIHGLGWILKHPYTTDLTYAVDFQFLKFIAEKHGADASVGTMGPFMHNLMSETGLYDEKIKGPDPEKHPGYSRLLLPDEFRVLQITK